MGKRFAIVIGAAALGVMALGAQTTTAAPGVVKYDKGLPAVQALASQTAEIDSRVVISRRDVRRGRVKSSKYACEVQRTVKVFRRRSGPDKLIGKDSSNGHGKWVVQFQISPGFYYAKVLPREVRTTAGKTFVCRGDRSRVVDLH